MAKPNKNIKPKPKEIALYISVEYRNPKTPPDWVRSENSSIDYMKIVARELAHIAAQHDLGDRREWGEITAYEVVTNRWNIDRKKIEELIKLLKKRRVKFSRETKMLKALADVYTEQYLSLF